MIALLGEMAVFVKVVETGSFSETARQLGATPSAISRSVARLEKALGTRLLQRTTRKLRLSESGHEVHRRCVDMVSAAQAVMAVSGQFDPEPQGLIRVSVPKAVGRFVIHPHIPDFLARYPKIDVLLQLKDSYVDLIDDQVDLAIRITDRPSPGLMGRKLIDIDHMLCATPDYLKRQGTPEHPHDLKVHNCIFLGEEPGDSRWKFQRNGKNVSVNVHGRYAVNHTGARLDTEWEFKTHYYCGEAWVLYPPTRYLPPKLSAFISFMAERLGQEPTLYKEPPQELLELSAPPYESPETSF